MSRTREELQRSLDLIAIDVEALKRIDALLCSAVLECGGGYGPIAQSIGKARRDITRRVEDHHEAAGVIRTRLREAER